MNFNTRRAGILLHPTSLPSCTLEDVERWLDFLQAAGITVWQMLPLGIPLSGLSPYQCASAFAVNPALFPGARADMRGFSSWRKKQHHWLDDYARFMVIKQEQGGAPWTDWPRELRDRDAQTLSAFDISHADALKAVMAEQYRSAVRGRPSVRRQRSAVSGCSVTCRSSLRTTVPTCGPSGICFCWMKRDIPPW
ncbi:4-alpha-glucanotransferase [Thiobacillus sp.]|uniref:4-alpha-glucanotransferase n=1 Tax=Thiobacillus sp. TaxID=924 RepID=UPI0025FDB757|nr:4-alpha-glucanotransferase [Thiobacillus sp.]